MQFLEKEIIWCLQTLRIPSGYAHANEKQLTQSY